MGAQALSSVALLPNNALLQSNPEDLGGGRAAKCCRLRLQQDMSR